MECFHNFTAPLWELFVGNSLLLICSLFYLAWWVVAFRPGSNSGAAGVVLLALAFLSGISAIILMSVSINVLSRDSKALPLRLILLFIAVLYLATFLITTSLFHRAVTSELLIMHIWVAIELCAVTVLYGTGRLDFGRMAVMAALVGIATVVGLICYVLYYRLDGMSSYWDGMIPLATDAFVMAVFDGVLMLS